MHVSSAYRVICNENMCPSYLPLVLEEGACKGHLKISKKQGAVLSFFACIF